MATIRGLGAVRVGDALGESPGGDEATARFPRPALEAVVVARRPEEQGSLRAALAQLAEQDPLIDVRQDDARHEISVSLYGEVQKEVIAPRSSATTASPRTSARRPRSVSSALPGR